MTFHILGISSSQLTNSYFSEGLVETTKQYFFVVISHHGIFFWSHYKGYPPRIRGYSQRLPFDQSHPSVPWGSWLYRHRPTIPPVTPWCYKPFPVMGGLLWPWFTSHDPDIFFFKALFWATRGSPHWGDCALKALQADWTLRLGKTGDIMWIWWGKCSVAKFHGSQEWPSGQWFFWIVRIWPYSYGSVSKPCTPDEHQTSW